MIRDEFFRKGLLKFIESTGNEWVG